MTIPIQVLVNIDPPIATVQELAGRRFKTKLGGNPANVIFPLSGQAQGVGPIVRSTWPKFPGDSKRYVQMAKGMSASGAVRRLPTANELDVDALLFLLNPDETVDQSNIDTSKISTDIASWLDCFRSWIGIWTNTPQIDLSQTLHPLIKGAYKSGGIWTRFSSHGQTMTLVRGTYLAEADVMTAAIRAATRNIHLPAEYAMLTRSVNGAHGNKLRDAVMDACTAAELALSAAIREHLDNKDITRNSSEEILKNTTGLVEVFRLYATALGSSISINKVKSDLAGPRNLAIHRGDIPTVEVARRALKTATEIIFEARPLWTTSELLRHAKTRML